MKTAVVSQDDACSCLLLLLPPPPLGMIIAVPEQRHVLAGSVMGLGMKTVVVTKPTVTVTLTVFSIWTSCDAVGRPVPLSDEWCRRVWVDDDDDDVLLSVADESGTDVNSKPSVDSGGLTGIGVSGVSVGRRVKEVFVQENGPALDCVQNMEDPPDTAPVPTPVESRPDDQSVGDVVVWLACLVLEVRCREVLVSREDVVRVALCVCENVVDASTGIVVGLVVEWRLVVRLVE